MSRGAVLVAGGAGYIGSHVCKALKAAGYLPVTIDNLSTGHRDAVRWGPLVEADIRNAARVREAIRRHRVVGAMHFAALSSVADSVTAPLDYYENNVVGALAFAAALIDESVNALVFSSTAAVYGIPSVTPVPESHRTQPINPYGETKLAFEAALRCLAGAHQLRWIALRYFNAAGADPAGEIGERHDPETHLIPNLVRAALGTGPALHVFGNDYGTADGTAIRDYVHVADLADAHVIVLEHLLSGGESMTLNVGTSTGTSVLSLVDAAEQFLGRPIPYTQRARRAGDPPTLVADATLIRRHFGWKPTRSGVETILRTAFAWELSRESNRTRLLVQPASIRRPQNATLLPTHRRDRVPMHIRGSARNENELGRETRKDLVRKLSDGFDGR